MTETLLENNFKTGKWNTSMKWVNLIRNFKYAKKSKAIVFISPLTFTCLKSTIETLDRGAKYIKS